MFINRIIRHIRTKRAFAVAFLITGLSLLILAGYLAIYFTGSLNTIPIFLQDGLIYINHKLGAIPEADSRVFWYITRSSGITAYIILWITVGFGLLITTRTIKNIKKLPPVYETHKLLALLSISFALIHALVLLGESYIEFRFSDIAVPFVSFYRKTWVGLGIMGFYLMAILILSFYIRYLITFRGWRILHYSTFAAWIIITLHAIKSGTDTSTWIMRLVYLFSISSVALLVTVRVYFSIKSRFIGKTKYKWIDREDYGSLVMTGKKKSKKIQKTGHGSRLY